MTSDLTDRETEAKREDSYRRWDTPTKRIVAVIGLLFLALVVYQFRSLLRPLVLAFLLAFILNPIVDFLEDRVGMHRSLAAALVFLVLIIAILGVLAAPVTAVPSVQRAIISAQLDLRQIIDDINAFFGREIEIAGYSFDLSFLAEELSVALRRFFESVFQGTLDLVVSLAQGALWIVFIFIVAFYLVRDAHHIAERIVELAPPGYRDDAVRLRREIVHVWNAFLRGELLLGTVVGVTVGLVTTGLGLPYPWALGLLAGVLEIVPNIGPTIAAIPAILLALINGSAYIPLGNFWFAVLVAGVYTIIQLIENNFLVPRIMGRTLNLHPLAVLIAVLAGGQLASILGILLAAPTLATTRVLGRYLLARLYDRDPFAEPLGVKEEEETPRRKPGAVEKVREGALERLTEKVRRAAEQHAEGSDSSGAGE
ncbi:MAG: AI-2E family transporter [Chloroflexota bacterium]|nr:AI-2E family transporter [Chloroflexota bacterium]